MTIRSWLFLGGFIALAALWLLRVSVNLSRFTPTRDTVHFPTVSGQNLMRQEMTFPSDFGGEINIVFIAFLQEQQRIVNTWVPFAQQVEADNPNVAYYEFPTLWEMTAMRRTFLNEGMRAGIPDPTSRERTITLYLDLQGFMTATDIPSRSEMHTLLVNRDGDILWRTTGAFTEAKGQSLLDTLTATQ